MTSLCTALLIPCTLDQYLPSVLHITLHFFLFFSFLPPLLLIQQMHMYCFILFLRALSAHKRCQFSYILALLRKKKDSEQHAHKIYFGVRSLPSIYWHTFETHVCSQRSHISAVWQGKWMKITYGTVSRVHVEDREFGLSSYLTLLFSFSLLDTQTHTHTNQWQDPDVKWPKNCKVIKQLDQKGIQMWSTSSRTAGTKRTVLIG